MLFIANGHMSLAEGFLQLIDYLALFYLVLLLWIPFYWLVFHTAIRFWRRWGNRAFWGALPVWLIFAAGIILSHHGLVARRLERNALTWAVGGVLFSWQAGSTCKAGTPWVGGAWWG